eukprot:g8119.t1 g8119   contig27:231656-232371(+)
MKSLASRTATAMVAAVIIIATTADRAHASCSFPSTSHLSTPSNIKLTLIKSNSLCADRSGKEYSYGGFDSQTTLDQCFNSCAVDKALFLSRMVGVDWNCGTGACDCLYEAFTLNNNDCKGFDRCHNVYMGSGQVEGSTAVNDIGCYKKVDNGNGFDRMEQSFLRGRE